jgi:uncharacterized membrane protein required for colicin V production
VVIVGYLALGALSGWRRGLVMVAFSIAGYLVGLLAASRYQHRVTRILAQDLPIAHWVKTLVPAPAASVPGAALAATRLADSLLSLLVFLLILGASAMVARILGHAVTVVVRRLMLLRGLNTLGGILGGFVENAVIAGLVLGLIVALPFLAHGPVSHAIHHTPLAQVLMRWVAGVVHWPQSRWIL